MLHRWKNAFHANGIPKTAKPNPSGEKCFHKLWGSPSFPMINQAVPGMESSNAHGLPNSFGVTPRAAVWGGMEASRARRVSGGGRARRCTGGHKMNDYYSNIQRDVITTATAKA